MARHGEEAVGTGDVRRDRRRTVGRAVGWAAVVAVGLVGMAVARAPVLASGFDLFPGPRGDTRLIAYLVEHSARALTGRAAWLSPAMFYPAPGTLAYSDALVLYVPPYALLRAAGLDIFHALSATVLLFDVLNYAACLVLLRGVLGLDLIASAAGAAFFAFNNPKLAQPDHLQLQPVLLLPLIAACVVVLVSRASRLRPAQVFTLGSAAALTFVVQLFTSAYLGWFLLWWGVLLAGLCVVVPVTRRHLVAPLRRHGAALGAAALVLAAALVPFVVVYVGAAHAVGWYPYAMALRYVPGLRSPLLMGTDNYVWGAATEALVRATGGDPDWGRRIGLGVVASLAWLGATAVAARTVLRDARASDDADTGRAARRVMVALLVLSVDLVYLVGFQYRGHSAWHLVYAVLPGARSIRAVARYAIVLTLPMAIVFAVAVARARRWIAARRGRGARAALLAGLLVLVAAGLAEQPNGEPGFSISRENARLARLAAALPAGCAAFYVIPSPGAPHEQERLQYQHDAMLVSVLRGVPTLNGRSGKAPPGWSLWEMRAPDYEASVARWITRHPIPGPVCRLEIPD